MLRLRWLSMPRRPTYPTSTVVAHGSWRSTVRFQLQAFGIGKSGSCAVTTSGKSRRAPPAGAAAEPFTAVCRVRKRAAPPTARSRGGGGSGGGWGGGGGGGGGRSSA